MCVVVCVCIVHLLRSVQTGMVDMEFEREKKALIGAGDGHFET